eukprot:GILK01007243.1.p1 GENE.GILK01007243.1~~GILK01007243.1.p1  ORF type:complete len:229 (-),score=20.23 GILK01007243.1:72-722(-)
MEDLFGKLSDDENDGPQSAAFQQQYEIKTIQMADQSLQIREFSFHPLNANYVWPGNEEFSRWIVDNWFYFQNKRVLELGSASGILSIFLKKREVDITTSDFADDEIAANIAHNCSLNHIETLPHIPHTWGTPLPPDLPPFDLIVASDILLYVKAYPALVTTLTTLLDRVPGAIFIMSWKRRIGEQENIFFGLVRDSGFVVQEVGSRIYKISRTACQ